MNVYKLARWWVDAEHADRPQHCSTTTIVCIAVLQRVRAFTTMALTTKDGVLKDGVKVARKQV